MKLYITDEASPRVAIADNIEEAAKLLFVNEEDTIESIIHGNDYYRVRVMQKYGWITTEFVNEYELKNHKVYD